MTPTPVPTPPRERPIAPLGHLIFFSRWLQAPHGMAVSIIDRMSLTAHQRAANAKFRGEAEDGR